MMTNMISDHLKQLSMSYFSVILTIRSHKGDHISYLNNAPSNSTSLQLPAHDFNFLGMSNVRRKFFFTDVTILVQLKNKCHVCWAEKIRTIAELLAVMRGNTRLQKKEC